jgi:Cys-rich repeat protein
LLEPSTEVSGKRLFGLLLAAGCGARVDMTPTPAVDAAADTAGCRSNSDCPPPEPSNVWWGCEGPYLRGPNQHPGGPPREPLPVHVPCTEDSQCGAGQVCRHSPYRGWLGPVSFVCSPPCVTDLDCSPTDRCESGGHCRPRSCSECPSYLSCTSGSCVIPSCSTDSDCVGGHCVNNRCGGSLGVCRLVVY